jgi:hypothetical protein
MRAKCQCGCGQAPSSTCRERKAECRGCGYVIRVTHKWIATGLPMCPCGEQLECRCLEDRMVAGDTLAYSAMMDRAAMPNSTGKRSKRHDNRAGSWKPAVDIPF